MSTERHVAVTADDGREIDVTLIERRAATKTADNVRTLFGHADGVAYGDEHDVIVDGVVLGTISHRVTEVSMSDVESALCERWSAEPVDFSLGVSAYLISQFLAVRALLTKYGRI